MKKDNKKKKKIEETPPFGISDIIFRKLYMQRQKNELDRVSK